MWSWLIEQDPGYKCLKWAFSAGRPGSAEREGEWLRHPGSRSIEPLLLGSTESAEVDQASDTSLEVLQTSRHVPLRTTCGSFRTYSVSLTLFTEVLNLHDKNCHWGPWKHEDITKLLIMRKSANFWSKSGFYCRYIKLTLDLLLVTCTVLFN